MAWAQELKVSLDNKGRKGRTFKGLHGYIPSTQETEVGRSQVQGQKATMGVLGQPVLSIKCSSRKPKQTKESYKSNNGHLCFDVLSFFEPHSFFRDLSEHCDYFSQAPLEIPFTPCDCI